LIAFRSSSENIRKMNSQPISNKNLPPAHMELELGMLSGARKLVKDTIHSRQKKIGKNLFFSL
jgi:hypothetical protein